MAKKASKRRSYSASSVARLKREFRKEQAKLDAQIDELSREIGSLKIANAHLERQKRELGGLFRTAEAYYRAQAIIAELLSREDASISAILKQDILNAIYYGVAKFPVRESTSRGGVVFDDGSLTIKGSQNLD